MARFTLSTITARDAYEIHRYSKAKMWAQIDDDDDSNEGERLTENSPCDAGNSTSFKSLAIGLSG